MSWIDVLNASGHRIVLGDGHHADVAVEVLHWAYAPHLPDNIPHRHTYIEACFIGHYGAGRFTVNGRDHAIKAGDAFFARPGVIHRIQNTLSPGMELFWVSFAFAPEPSGTDGGQRNANKPSLQLAEAFAASPVLVAPDDGSLASTWNALRQVAEHARGGNSPALEHLKAALVLTLLQLGTPASEIESPIARDDAGRNASLIRVAVRYIHDNLDRRLPVSEVAAHVHLSPRHLVRLMRAQLGTAPADYIEQARLDRARALLRGSDLPLKAVGTQVGYPDAHHFSRVFARRFGVAPGAFRRGESGQTGLVPHDGALV